MKERYYTFLQTLLHVSLMMKYLMYSMTFLAKVHSRLFFEESNMLTINECNLILSCLYRKSSINGKNANYISEDDFEFPKLIPIRA